MNFCDIAKQWKKVNDELLSLQENINVCLGDKDYANEQEMRDLLIMQGCCNKFFQNISFGYFC